MKFRNVFYEGKWKDLIEGDGYEGSIPFTRFAIKW